MRRCWRGTSSTVRSGGLFSPLDHDQGAPTGFLVIQKLVVSFLGTGECAFRLVPTVLSVWGLFLFAGVTERLFGRVAAVRVLPFFAFNPFLVLTSNKQYPVDLWASLFLTSLALKAVDARAGWRELGVFGVVGACLIWVPHPIPLVEAGVGMVVILAHARAGRWGRAVAAGGVAGCWLVSFAASYYLCVRHLHANAYLVAYWELGFPPVGEGVGGYCVWLGRTLYTWFITPGRFGGCTELAVAVAALGAVYLARNPVRLGFVALPALVAVVAASARAFPYHGRLITFLVPVSVWLVAAGLDALNTSPNRVVRIAAWVGLVALLWHPTLDARRQLLRPNRWEESREVFRFVSDHARPGDVVYVHLNARHTFEFYRPRLRLGDVSVVHGGESVPAEAVAQILGLPAGARVWVVYSETLHSAYRVVPLTRAETLASAAAGRVELDRREAPEVCAVLYGVRCDGPSPAAPSADYTR